ncbi:MAG TPA: hypothetical protein VF203_04340 [Burkholderiales bacterium]
MVKLSLWLGMPPLITFLASPSGVRLVNAAIVFVLALLALVVGIGPRFTGRH